MSIIWITGLAGAGKTTLAQRLAAQLECGQSRDGGAQRRRVALVDGDEVRKSLGDLGRGYSRDERLAVARHISGLATAHSRGGGDAIVSTISLFHEIHAMNRATGEDYFEVLLDCAPELRSARIDGRRRLTGPQIGIELAAEFPLMPHLRLDSGAHAAPLLAERVLQAWRQRHV